LRDKNEILRKEEKQMKLEHQRMVELEDKYRKM